MIGVRRIHYKNVVSDERRNELEAPEIMVVQQVIGVALPCHLSRSYLEPEYQPTNVLLGESIVDAKGLYDSGQDWEQLLFGCICGTNSACKK